MKDQQSENQEAKSSIENDPGTGNAGYSRPSTQKQKKAIWPYIAALIVVAVILIIIFN